MNFLVDKLDQKLFKDLQLQFEKVLLINAVGLFTSLVVMCFIEYRSEKHMNRHLKEMQEESVRFHNELDAIHRGGK